MRAVWGTRDKVIIKLLERESYCIVRSLQALVWALISLFPLLITAFCLCKQHTDESWDNKEGWPLAYDRIGPMAMHTLYIHAINVLFIIHVHSKNVSLVSSLLIVFLSELVT